MERIVRIIKEKASAMRKGANLPEYLIRTIYHAAVYLYNRTLKYARYWQTPIEAYYLYLAFQDGVSVTYCKPNQAHLKAYGSKAYVLASSTKLKQERLYKLNPKAWIDCLVGYRSSNIYEVWNPLTHKVVSTRDVTFNEQAFFSGKIEDLRDDLGKLNEEAIRKELAEL